MGPYFALKPCLLPEGRGALRMVPAEPPSTEAGRPHRPYSLSGHTEENKAESLWMKLLTSFFLSLQKSLE